LTPELQEKLTASIRAGNFRYVACLWVGLGERTFDTWMKRGKERPRTVHGVFRRAVLEAEKAAEMRCVALIMKAASGDAKHAEWWLERKYPQRWGRTQRHEITGKNGNPIQTESEVGDLAEALADPQLRELLDAVAERAAALAAAKSTSKTRLKT
jgi:hypothetical protein